MVGWSTETESGAATPFRVVGAHAESQNLWIKTRPDLARAGWQLLGVEIYGGLLFNSWLDRDLGLSGRVAVRARGGVETRLVMIDEPVLRVAQLAPHLDRGANEGLALNAQQHLTPLWGVSTEPGDFRAYIGAAVGAEAADVLSWDVMTHDLQPSRRIGRDLDLIAAPRLDNLATSYAGVRALIDVVGPPTMSTAEPGSAAASALASPHRSASSRRAIPVLGPFDHEEVGSQSERVAMSTWLPTVPARTHRVGPRRLFALQFKEQLKFVEKNIPGLQQMGMQFMTMGSQEELRDQIIQKAIDSWRGMSKADTAAMHALERRREKLLSDDKVLTALLAEHPELDAQHLRTLLRNARK